MRTKIYLKKKYIESLYHNEPLSSLELYRLSSKARIKDTDNDNSFSSLQKV